MRRDGFLKLARIFGSLALSMLLVFSSACSNEDQSERAALLASLPAQRLVGTWTARFWVDAGSNRSGRLDSTAVNGTISLEEDTYGRISTDVLDNATHAGVYNLDFSKFGFSARERDELPAAIARVGKAMRGVSGDSLTIVLNPGTTLFPVVMSGIVFTDSAAGQWTAGAYRSGGVSGHFLMKRLR